MIAPLSPRIAALVAAARAKHADAVTRAEQARLQAASLPTTAKPAPVIGHLSETSTLARVAAVPGTNQLVYDTDQLAAIELSLQGKSICLIGAAGTGKTTVTQEIITRLQRAPHVLPLASATKNLIQGAPGIVICGFTNKAVNNIRKKLPKHLQAHCITIHKLLEYQPEYYEIIDDTGMARTTMRFIASMNRYNPLPHISTLIFEESSMIGTDLYAEVIAALPRASQTQIIFLGDLNQIPPVFGPSILGFKLGELRTIELNTVYRQALLSPIISLATAIRLNNKLVKGFNTADHAHAASDTSLVPTQLHEKRTIDNTEHGLVTIHPWKQRVSNDQAIKFMRSFLPTLIESGKLDPAEDVILCPFNKSFGTIELNKIMADYLVKQRKEEVFEVIARYIKSYWAVGDRVMVDRHEALITKIQRTIGYGGKLPRTESATLDRWGIDPLSDLPASDMSHDDVLDMLDTLGGDEEGTKNLASHTITVYIPDLDETRLLNTAGEINNMIFGYALTIHKSQGSEWQRVFLFLHNSHATMLSRELVYTAITRAKHELYIICEGDSKGYDNSLTRAANRPIIPGTLLAEKIEFFRAKAKNYVDAS